MKQKGFSPVLILVLIAIAAAGYFGFTYLKTSIIKFTPTPAPEATSKPTDQPSLKYTCPESGYADCIPTVGQAKPECSVEAMNWYKANCPNFKGGAY